MLGRVVSQYHNTRGMQKKYKTERSTVAKYVLTEKKKAFAGEMDYSPQGGSCEMLIMCEKKCELRDMRMSTAGEVLFKLGKGRYSQTGNMVCKVDGHLK